MATVITAMAVVALYLADADVAAWTSIGIAIGVAISRMQPHRLVNRRNP
jgi:hypothetical protein